MRLLTNFAIKMDDLNLDIFNLLDTQPTPARGSLLVAKPTVEDFCFKRSVTLIVDNDHEEGTMGLIVNRPTLITLENVMPEVEGAGRVPLYLGGPVGTNQLFFIHTLGAEVIPQSEQIVPGVFLGGDFEAIKMYLASEEPLDGKIKFMIGYSGWSAGQLDDELKRHDWAVLKSHAASLIFDFQDQDVWDKAVASFGEQYRMWRNWPDDVTMN